MANEWTDEALADQVLEYIGKKPAGQSAPAEHADYVKKAWLSLHDRLQDRDLAPFAIDNIPTWAHEPLKRWIAYEVGPHFGKRYTEKDQELAEQSMAAARYGGPRSGNPTRYQGY